MYYPLFALFLSRLACGLLWIKKRSRKTRSALAKFRVQCKLFNSALNLCRNTTWLILASAAVLYLRLKNIYFFASCEHNVWYRELKRLRVFFKYWKVCIGTVCPVSDQRKNCRISFLMQISDQIPGIPRVLNSRSRRSVGCSKVWKWSKMVRWFGSDEFEPLRSFCLSFTRPGDFKYRR